MEAPAIQLEFFEIGKALDCRRTEHGPEQRLDERRLGDLHCIAPLHSDAAPAHLQRTHA